MSMAITKARVKGILRQLEPVLKRQDALMESLHKVLFNEIREKLPKYFIKVGYGIEPGFVNVSVYNVPDNECDKVENYIYKLGRDIFCNRDFTVLSHVKNEAITAEYYPQYYQKPNL